MSTEKMREEFEAWVEANFGLSVRRNPAGAYQSFGVYAAWEAWQASRAALVIELPQIVAYEAGYDSLRDNEYASQSGEFFDADEVFALHRSMDVREAIEAAGVRVKP
ncbi:hypothetical protein [Pseudomonas typographi]|uniref:hypothetical protein n=1 Tax=Pseudomonas typographi TaxID=2715964 RepID=UPI001689A504|nr:hypothetical protein [Pseudomonas typographi]MBD1555240.1 hypothetical protein [Pseudomonas typographi]